MKTVIFKFGYQLYHGYVDNTLCDYISIPYTIRGDSYRIPDDTLKIKINSETEAVDVFMKVIKLYDDGVSLDMIKDYMEL